MVDPYPTRMSSVDRKSGFARVTKGDMASQTLVGIHWPSARGKGGPLAPRTAPLDRTRGQFRTSRSTRVKRELERGIHMSTERKNSNAEKASCSAEIKMLWDNPDKDLTTASYRGTNGRLGVARGAGRNPGKRQALTTSGCRVSSDPVRPPSGGSKASFSLRWTLFRARRRVS
jgi:hypothetical protein